MPAVGRPLPVENGEVCRLRSARQRAPFLYNDAVDASEVLHGRGSHTPAVSFPQTPLPQCPAQWHEIKMHLHSLCRRLGAPWTAQDIGVPCRSPAVYMIIKHVASRHPPTTPNRGVQDRSTVAVQRHQTATAVRRRLGNVGPGLWADDAKFPDARRYISVAGRTREQSGTWDDGGRRFGAAGGDMGFHESG
jgi:hypothetical protein